jgi:uncharacterized protein involved in propanediol utilization
MDDLVFELPVPSAFAVKRAAVQVYTHKGEWLQGPIQVMSDSGPRYTMGVFSLLDKLNSAYVDVRHTLLAPPGVPQGFVPTINVHPNGWNEGEVKLVKTAVEATWRELAGAIHCEFDVYGYHDIRVGAGSGSSSALVQAAIRATAADLEIDFMASDQLAFIHARIEQGADPLHLTKPAVVATRVNLGRFARPLGERMPKLIGVTWDAGPPVRTTSVKFKYSEDEFLLWKVRWASLERAIRFADDSRVARLAVESARDNQTRNPKVDFELLEEAVASFGAAGFAVAHTGSYHTALFPVDAPPTRLQEYVERVQSRSKGNDPPSDNFRVRQFDTAKAAKGRFVQ